MGGLLFDLLVPFLLVGPSPTLRYGVAFPAALAFHRATGCGLAGSASSRRCASSRSSSSFLNDGPWRGHGGEAPAPPPARRRPLLVAAAVAVGALHGLLPLRHLLLPEASRWTGEGSLWAWHMKLSAKRGWLALHVAMTDADGAAREFTLVPETDPSLYADQAGHLTHEPASTLQYARHLRALFAAKGYAVAAVRASSCVAVNGRPAQPLFVADANLLAHADGDYLGVFALRSGVGTFLHPGARRRRACDLARPQGAADDDAAAAVQRASDAAYRWLHAPLHRRAALAEWAWVGRSRVPSALADAGEACDATGRDALPSWATRCSFLSAAEALWCPE